jgi:hypothetical protein
MFHPLEALRPSLKVGRYLFIHGERSFLILFLSLLVLGGLVECLEPDIAESDVRVGVITGLGLLQDSLKLLLAYSQLYKTFFFIPNASANKQEYVFVYNLLGQSTISGQV